MSFLTTPAPPAAPSGAAARRVPTKRNAELGLLALAMLLVLAFNVAVEAAALQVVSTGVITMPLLLSVLFFGVHVLLRFVAPYSDPIILPCVALINGIGVLFIRRVDLAYVAVSERVDYPTFAGLGIRQFFWTAVAVLGFSLLLVLLRDHRVLSRYAYTLALVGMVLVALPAVLPSSISDPNDAGAKLWIAIPGIGTIQPSEFAKLALLSFFAYYLVRKREVLSLASKRILGIDFPRPRDMFPVLIIWGCSLLLLIFERDLGTSLMYFGAFVAMMYIATERTSWLIIGLGLFSLGAVFAHSVNSRLQLRVSIWLDPFSDPHDGGFQLVQSLFGLGTGGLFGTGPGAGNPREIPVVRSDFITAGLGEEIGLFGLTVLLILYLVIVVRGLRTAHLIRDSFGKLLAAGLAFSLGLQVFVIVGGVSRLIPLTGLTTPFLSLGGSSLVANWLLAGLLLRISDAARRPAGAAIAPQRVPSRPQSATPEVIKP